MSRIASFSKGFISQKSLDDLMSSIPLFSQSLSLSSSSSSSSPSPSFRTITIPSIIPNDPELSMGDDCDASYEAALLNSGLFNRLDQDDSNLFHHSASQKRLEMFLLHLASTDPATKNRY